jgi:nucleoporin NUP42
MSGGDESTKIQPESVLQTAQGVATTLEHASAPGPVPFGTGASPIDGAASGASGTVIRLVSAASADLAPRAGEVLGATESAVAGLQNADAENTTDLGQVGAQAEMQVPGQAGSAAAAGGAAAQGGPASSLSGVLGPLQEAASAGAGGVEQVASSGAEPFQQAASSVASPLQQVASTATGATGASPDTSQPGSHGSHGGHGSPGGRVEPDEFGHFQTPVVPIDPGGAGAGSTGGGTAPV